MQINWQKRLNHLRFAEDIAIISDKAIELPKIFYYLEKEASRVGLKMNIQRTKVMCKEDPNIKQIIPN